MPTIGFRLTKNLDPEERLEEAALWKAFHDFYGNDVVAIDDEARETRDIPTFGRDPRSYQAKNNNPVSSILEYWNDPAFQKFSGRKMWVCDWDEAKKRVQQLRDIGVGAFIKSTRTKHFVCKVPATGASFDDVMGDMAYSFIDGGPKLLVQELVDMKYEHRFFVIDRKIVTHSPVQVTLTPLDYPLPDFSVSRTPNSSSLEASKEILSELHRTASRVADEMEYPHAAIDCAITTSPDRPNGTGCVIEFNPMKLGQLGLYACNVRKLAEASPALLKEFKPASEPTFKMS